MNECHLTRILRLAGKRDGVEDDGIVLVASLSDEDDDDDDDREDVDRCNTSELVVNTTDSICLSTLLVPRPESFLSVEERI